MGPEISVLFVGPVPNPYGRPHDRNPPRAPPGNLPLTTFVGLASWDNLLQLLTLEIGVI